VHGALYAAFGVQSPYLPSLLDSHGLPPEAIALVLAAGTAIRLAAGPAAGHLADRLDAPKAVLIVCSAAAGLIALGYLPARVLGPLLIVGVIAAKCRLPYTQRELLDLARRYDTRADHIGRRPVTIGCRRAVPAGGLLGMVRLSDLGIFRRC
jgi:MFS family permease